MCRARSSPARGTGSWRSSRSRPSSSSPSSSPEREVLMNTTIVRRTTCLAVCLGLTVLSAAEGPDLRKRLTPAEVTAVRTEVAGPGTSGLAAVSTRVLFGDPTKPGLYTVELRVAPHTTIPAHTHRDVRTAV